MQNQSANPLENFLNAKFLLKDAYGITMTDEDFVERAYRGFRKLGNIATATHKYRATVENGTVKLPCNVEFIESVSTKDIVIDHINDVIYSIDNNHSMITNQYYYPDIVTAGVYNKVNLSRTQLHPNGVFIPYEICGKNEYIKVKEQLDGEEITIIYRGQVLDEDGLPALTSKEVEAIACFVAYYDVKKRIFMKEPGLEGMWSIIQQEYPRLMAAAKIPEYLSQSFWDELLSANTRFDRKQFGSSYKLMR